MDLTSLFGGGNSASTTSDAVALAAVFSEYISTIASSQDERLASNNDIAPAYKEQILKNRQQLKLMDAQVKMLEAQAKMPAPTAMTIMGNLMGNVKLPELPAV